VTWADLVNFRPQPGVARMDPDGWSVVGVPTNFWTDTGTHQSDALLLGIPATVRFTPVAFRWDYGDGSTVSLTRAGSGWREPTSASRAGSGVGRSPDEFRETPTSHVFDTRGSYPVSLVITFTAEYRFAGGAAVAGFVPIAGSVDVPVAGLSVRVVTVDTVLTSGPCTRRGGPGC
jgi:PKD repeat protein